MPYIPSEARAAAAYMPENAGELNYAITRLVWDYIKRHGMSYITVNAAIGAMECAKLELYRRQAAPYEDRKIEINGDVYT